MISLILTTLAAFVLADYALGRFGMRDQGRLLVAVIFAVIVFLVELGVTLS